MAKKFYVVWRGREPGIYNTWEQCQAQVHGFPAAKFKSFPTYGLAAEAYGLSPTSMASPNDRSTPGPGPGKSSGRLSMRSALEGFEYALFCDGGCHPNPGPSGTGMAVFSQGAFIEGWFGQHDPNGTNNTAELNGIMMALRHCETLLASGAIANSRQAAIYCDSQYAIKSVTAWSRGWERNGWVKSDGGEIQNLHLIQEAVKLHRKLSGQVSIRHVKGHSGMLGNEYADQLATMARKKKESGWAQLADRRKLSTKA